MSCPTASANCARRVSTSACNRSARHLEKPSRLRDIRREVARIETILSERTNKAVAAGVKA